MLSLEFYRWFHVVSLCLILLGLVGILASRLSKQPVSKSTDRTFVFIHGFGMIFMLVAGFGAMARLGYMTNWPWWIYAKLALWFFMGASIALAKRKSALGFLLIGAWMITIATGAYLGIFKP